MLFLGVSFLPSGINKNVTKCETPNSTIRLDALRMFRKIIRNFGFLTFSDIRVICTIIIIIAAKPPANMIVIGQKIKYESQCGELPVGKHSPFDPSPVDVLIY